MNYGTIKNHDIANGKGVRVSLFVSGCTNRCQGCFQPETWDFNYGEPFTDETRETILKMLEPHYMHGLTVLGGEPFEFSNQKVLAPFLKEVKQHYPDKDIWIYTGFVLDDLLEGGKRNGPDTASMLENIDVLVDGPFVEDLKDISLAFRGSSNQRILDLQKTLKEGTPVFYPLKIAKSRR